MTAAVRALLQAKARARARMVPLLHSYYSLTPLFVHTQRIALQYAESCALITTPPARHKRARAVRCCLITQRVMRVRSVVRTLISLRARHKRAVATLCSVRILRAGS